MLVAVVFPEVVLSAAWQQSMQARQLVKSGRSHLQQADAPGEQESQLVPVQEENHSTTWTDAQAFFVVMGGFAVERVDEIDEKTTSTKCVFTADGMQLMKQAGLAPQFAKSDVEERSNADIIAKTIVVVQVLWFATQLLARTVEGMAITALEVHTLVHVGCAILMYVLWWHKPYAISRSVVLRDRKSIEVAALYLFSNILHKQYRTAMTDHTREKMEYWERRALSADVDLLNQQPPPRMPRKTSTVQALELYNMPGRAHSNRLSEEEKRLYVLASDAFAGYNRLSAHNADVGSVFDQSRWRGVRHNAENFALRQVWGSWSRDEGHEMSLAKLTHFIFNLLYGGGHLAAWNSQVFPTKMERWMWRVSAVHIGGLFVYGSLWTLYWSAARSRSKWLVSFRNGDADIVVGPFFCLMGFGYVIARCYFFVESLISLRSLPASAYDIVRWTDYLPHSS